jgi:general secretion pathway protein D
MRMTGLALVVGMVLSTAAIYAQDMHEAGVYKVEFTLRDSTDAGAKNGRKYSMLINRGNKAVMKVGNRVPTATGTSGGIGQVNTQFTYIDIGVNIDCTVDERNGKYLMHADMDLSTVIPAEKTGNSLPNPTVSQIKINMDTTLVPGKPTVVASFDDPGTARKFDVDVTLTKM